MCTVLLPPRDNQLQLINISYIFFLLFRVGSVVLGVNIVLYVIWSILLTEVLID